MCGLCGIVHRDHDRPVPPDVLDAMLRALRHRGPHGEGSHVEPGAGLAARCLRLNARDIDQPASNTHGTVWAMLDGAIYNAAGLRARLERQGHPARTPCSAGLLACLYDAEGERFFDLLIGEYALAVWDGARRRLFLVRDRLGVKPLYFAHVNGTLVFASELRAVIQHPEVNRAIDLDGFSEYLTFQHALAPRTALAGVQKLPAGYVAIYGDGTLTLRRYWDLRFPPEDEKDPDFEQHVARFRAGFETAIRRRLPADGQAGAFLSGGMDSSSIVAMADHVGARDLHTYSGGYRTGEDEGELDRARLVADHFGTRHFELTFSADMYREMLPRFIAYMDDPVADEASPIRMLLADRATRDVRVILGGEGGDDVIAGYSFAVFQQRFDRIRRFQRLPFWLRATLPAVLSPFLPGSVRAWLARGNRDPATINADEHYGMVWAFEAEEKRRYCPVLAGGDHCHDLVREVYANSRTADPLSQALYFMTKVWAAENLMMSADKMASAHGLQFRAPFLDHELVELCAAIPSRYKVRREPDGSYTIKAVLREAMHGILPDIVMGLPKLPFQVPTTEWFQDTLACCCRDTLLSDRARASGLYDLEEVAALIAQHCRAPTPQSMVQIRNLLFFEMWRQNVLEGESV